MENNDSNQERTNREKNALLLRIDELERSNAELERTMTALETRIQEYIEGNQRALLEQALPEGEDIYRGLVELCPDAILVYSDEKIVFLNRRGLEMIGADSLDKVIGLSMRDFIEPELRESFSQNLKLIGEEKHVITLTEAKCIRFDGEVIDVESTSTHITFQGKPARLAIVREITERKIAEQKLRDANRVLRGLSNRDGLTGIANRRYFDEILTKEWSRCARHSKPLSLIILDIDYFKKYNDSYGHLGGDECLKKVAAMFEMVLKRPTDLVARYGGEEFAIILPEVPVEGAQIVAENLRVTVENLQLPHISSKISECITISLGVASIVPNKLIDSKMLISAADKALYKAKREGKNRVGIYTIE